MALNKSSDQRTRPPCANCSTGTSLASENQRGQSPSPSVTRALSVGAHAAGESSCETLNVRPPCAAGWVPDHLLTHTVFRLSGSGAFYDVFFPRSNRCCFWS